MPKIQPKLAVIGIGASAGGLEAATRLIDAWPPSSGEALILVQHADPRGGSMLAPLLAPHTTLTVLEAAEGTPVAPLHLYIIPPGRYLSVESGILRLSAPPVRHGARMPFDFLLHSLAKEYGDRTACVVLSGTGKDGTAGLTSVKNAGGTVAVQDPAEAAYDGMPRSALGTGLADFVLSVGKVPAAVSGRLKSAVKPSGSQARDTKNASGKTDLASAGGLGNAVATGLPDIIELLRTATANDFTLYKPGTLQRRIGRRLALAGLKPNDLAGYIDVLRADPTELQALGRDLLIHVTSFFRDTAVFDALAAKTIPDLVASHPAGQPLRVWVAGCSTGEETYSLAMLFLEQIEAASRPVRLQIFASDVDVEAIAAAREGIYPASIEEGVTPARLARFFVQDDAGWRAAPDLRAVIVFTVHDVLADPPFSRLDMVSCRNLLIYLQPDAQARVVEAFHFALRDGGILLLGSAETPVAPEGRFVTVAKAERIFRRIGHGGAGKPGAPARPAVVRPGEDQRRRNVSLPAAALRPAALAELGRRLVMEDYAPASVLIDGANAVLFSIGPTDRYLRLPPGHATQDLLSMARPGLRAKLRSALQGARKSKQTIRDAGWIAGAGASQPFKLVVRPVSEGDQHDLMLVSFLEAPSPKAGAVMPRPEAHPSKIAELQRELDATRTELQGTVRDLELSAEEQGAINQEALSVNEEYQSTNEELVASKEELQSLNEELTAVNSQLQETLERQRTMSDDLQNVLYSTNVATLFLDLEGRIRFFTPAIKALFSIIPGDVGRNLADFAALAPDAALAGDVKAVQEGQETSDREVEAAGGTWFRRRILPYRTSSGRVEGVVITFTNITARKAVGRVLEAAKLTAEAANMSKSGFLAAASHDLRQPLQTLALLQALLADTVMDEKAQSLVARQNVTLNTVTGILDALLDINEIDAGAVLSEISVFSIAGLLGRLRDEFGYHAKAKGIQLQIVPCGQSVRSDSRLLEQMVRNLISNAIKYTEKGRILVGCRRHGATLSLQVWDTGIGIETADLKSIFEEYYQAGNQARQRSRGLGLGLSIVKRLGVLLDHTIRVRSHPGRGSMFAIDLPWRPRLDGVARPQLTGTWSGQLKILVVEDDPDLAELLGDLLHGSGHDVTKALDGPAALKSLVHGRPDLVLTDYNLPNGTNGVELAKMIREAVVYPVPVLVLTGDISAATLRAAGEAGCMLLSKPTGLPELQDAIARLLAPPLSEGKPMIFVVDDNEDVRNSIIAVLEADGRIAAGYPSSEAFLQAFRPGAGDCLLIDAALPGISGIAVLEQLRAAGHSLPVIVVTGHGDVAMAMHAMKAGASDFITKPVSRTDLLASVVDAIEGSRDTDTLKARQDVATVQLAGLTPRQREIMTLVLAGQPSKNIAVDLGISQRTVENHRASIMHKTGTTSLPALARLALAAGSDSGVT